MARFRRKRAPKPRAKIAEDGKISRREVTEKLHEAVKYYYVKMMYSVFHEVGILRWGAARLDVLAIDLGARIIAVEIKSCLADFRTDKKWRSYLPYTNRMYMCFPKSVIESRVFPEIKEELKAEGVGILTLMDDGFIKCIMGATHRRMSVVKKFQIYKRLAWREGDSRRNIPRIKQVSYE